MSATWRLDSETGVLREVLLCRPDHYRWLDTNSIAHHTLERNDAWDSERAVAQFDDLVAVLEREGVNCRYLKPETHLHYQVYTRDSSQMTPWGPMLTQLRMPERRGEYARVIDFYSSTTPFWKYASAGTCEGGDIHVIRPGLALIGYSGVRTDVAGAQQLAAWFMAEGWEVRLQPFAAHFLHLDVLFCMARDDLAVACVDVLGTEFADWLKSHGIGLIEATYAEVMAMSCNLLSLGGDRVISPSHSVRINAELRSRGVVVFDPALDTFARGGGSIHCMTMPLRREPL